MPRKKTWVDKKVQLSIGQVGLGVIILIGLVSTATQFWLRNTINGNYPAIAVRTPTPTPTPMSIEEMIAEEMQKLTEGKILFNPPSEMRQGKAERIEARITSQDIGESLVQGLKGRGVPQVEAVQVGRFMKVNLYAETDEFHIANHSSEEQVVVGRPFAQWEWMVTPLSFGEHSLHLKATAKVNLERLGEKSVDVPVIDKNINVRISPIYIVQTTLSNLGYWPYIFGGLGLPAIAAAIWRYFFRKKRRPAGF